jgi:DNA-binding MarR family transcriptional regulator
MCNYTFIRAAVIARLARMKQQTLSAAKTSHPGKSPPVAPTECTAACMRRITRRMTAFYEPYLAPAGVSLSQYSLLSNLGEVAQSQTELANRLEMDRTTLTRNLKPLLAKRWVAMVAGDDARQRLFRLTPSGRKLRDAAHDRWKVAQNALETTLGAGLVANLHHELDQALAKLKPALPEEN